MQPRPDRARCKRAIKILEQFERLCKKLGVSLSPKRLSALKKLRDSGTIKATDLPARLRLQFPGEFTGMALDAIRRRCGLKRET